MGVVWQADDTKLHRQVALKVLPEALAGDAERRARFEREARAVAALNHPHVVTIYAVEEAETADGPVHFITMELVEGSSLKQRILRGGLPLGQVLEIGLPLVDAVAAAHRAGVIHRDLKPDNVMIDGEGRLRVLDFGLAKLAAPDTGDFDAHAATVTSETAAGRVLGTAAYMSPEQAEGKAVDERSDIFSLGTILYELATGVRPFHGDTTLSTLGSILKDEPRAVTDLKPALPRHAGRVIRRCLAKDPERRYQTAIDLRNELEELNAELEAGVDVEAPVKSASRIPIAVAALALVALAVVLLRDRPADPRPEYRPVPITVAADWDTDVCWSPDGRFISFSRMEAGHTDIYVKAIDSGEEYLRAGGEGDQFCARWTPDGRYLTYVTKSEPGTPVMLVPVDGGRAVRLVDTQLPMMDFDVAPLGKRPWLPGGQELLVSIVLERGNGAIHRVNRETGEAAQFTFPEAPDSDADPSVSFDGKHVLFTRSGTGAPDLMVVSVDGDEPRVVLKDEINLESPGWHPDGRILFASQRQGSSSMYALDVESGEVHRLTFDTREVQYPAVSSEGRIAYSVFWHDQMLYSVDRRGGAKAPITSSAHRNREVICSPDGRTLAFASERTGNFEIWLRDVASGAERRFTDWPSDEGKPEFSPDGRRLAFMSERDGETAKIFVANTDGGTEPRLLVDQVLNVIGSSTSQRVNYICAWSPDDALIAYRVLGSTSELWTVSPEGHGARQRLEGVTGFDWYLDSRRALITREKGTEVELLAVDLETGAEQSLLVGGLQEIAVAPDGSAVAFCYGMGHVSMGLAVLELEVPTQSNALPRAAGAPQYVVPAGESWHVHSAAWMPDGERLVYVHDHDYGNIYELVRGQ